MESTKLERHHEVEPQAPLIDIRQILVGQAADIVDTEELEDIVDADERLPVRFVAHDVALREKL